MLHYSTVKPGTLAVLKKLMSIPEMDSFYLVGGTALALYYGHRQSVDLDLFSSADFNTETLIAVLEKHFPDFSYSKPNNIGIFGFIGDIKVDFIRYHFHSMISQPVLDDGIRLIGLEDIMAMKIAAILKRAVKKDFWDIAELLGQYTVEQLINSYCKKYPNHQLLISIPQALTYFEDAEESDEPVSLKGQTWNSVKRKIQKSVAQYLK